MLNNTPTVVVEGRKVPRYSEGIKTFFRKAAPMLKPATGRKVPRYSEGIKTCLIKILKCVKTLFSRKVPRYSEGIKTCCSWLNSDNNFCKVGKYPVIQRGLRQSGPLLPFGSLAVK